MMNNREVSRLQFTFTSCGIIKIYFGLIPQFSGGHLVVETSAQEQDSVSTAMQSRLAVLHSH